MHEAAGDESESVVHAEEMDLSEGKAFLDLRR
jgi:hypothetical protein